MNNEITSTAGGLLLGEAKGAGWDGSDYAEEDCGCRGLWRGYSFEFQQILKVLAERR